MALCRLVRAIEATEIKPIIDRPFPLADIAELHDFPNGLSEGGWYHNFQPMRKREDEILSWGKPIRHPRRQNGQAEP